MTTTAHNRGFAGFSLVGILVVMAILFFLYFGPTGPGGKSAVQTAKESKDRAEVVARQMDLNQIAQVIVAHELSTGSTPETLEDLGMESHPIFRDPYGTMVTFKVESAASGRTLTITGAGRDREFGTEDDEIETTRMPL